MVELPDTASGSESSRGYNSTYIVSCFVLADTSSCKKPNLGMPWLLFLCYGAPRLSLITHFMIIKRPMGTQTLTSLLKTRHKLACMQHAQFSCFLHLSILTVFNRYALHLLMIRLSFVSPNCFNYIIVMP